MTSILHLVKPKSSMHCQCPWSPFTVSFDVRTTDFKMFYVRKSSVLCSISKYYTYVRTGTLSLKRVSDNLKESGRGRKSTVQTRRTDCRVVENWAAYTYPALTICCFCGSSAASWQLGSWKSVWIWSSVDSERRKKRVTTLQVGNLMFKTDWCSKQICKETTESIWLAMLLKIYI